MAEKTDTVAEIIDNIRRVFQVVNEHSKKAEHKTGLTGPQLWAIKTIAQGAPIMVSEIAMRMHLHPATVVGILDRLETHGLVRRVRSQEDRRVVRVELTGPGEDLVKSARSSPGTPCFGARTVEDKEPEDHCRGTGPVGRNPGCAENTSETHPLT